MERPIVPEYPDVAHAVTDERLLGIQAGANRGRAWHATVDGVVYARHPVRTPLITAADDPVAVMQRYARPLGPDVVLVASSERMLALTQGRSYPVSEIQVSWLARRLWPLVTQTGHGIGLGSPATMQLAIQEVGALRILLAALSAALSRPLGIHGLFYRVAGRRVAAIDGAAAYKLPPYDTEATLGPIDPDGLAGRLGEALGVPVAILDANDFGCEVLGASRGVDWAWVRRLFLDNPLGQNDQTPFCVVRRVPWPVDEALPPEPRRGLTPP